MTLFAAALLLFLVLDPFGNIPAFLTVLARVEERRRKRVMFLNGVSRFAAG